MEKQKRWQLYLIIAVLVLTLYNILPTVFYYMKPLKDPMNSSRAELVAKSIITRVNSLEVDTREWLESFCVLLKLKPISVHINSEDPKLFEVAFKNSNDANIFRRFLPRAGSLIPFAPAQLELWEGNTDHPEVVTVIRQVGTKLDPANSISLFEFSPKVNENGSISKLYRDVVNDRVMVLAKAFGGPSRQGLQLLSLSQSDSSSDDLVLSIAKEIVDIETYFGRDSALVKRYFATFAQAPDVDGQVIVQKFLSRIKNSLTQIEAQKAGLLKNKEEGILDFSGEQQLALYEQQISFLEGADTTLRRQMGEIKTTSRPLTESQIQQLISKSYSDMKESSQILSLEGRNPYVKNLRIDWANDVIALEFYPDVNVLRTGEEKTETLAIKKEKLNQYIINDIARASRIADESLKIYEDTFAVQLNALTNTTGILALKLGDIAEQQVKLILGELTSSWTPQHPDLKRELYPVWDYTTYRMLKAEDQKLGLLAYAPSMGEENQIPGLRAGSIYVIARGYEDIAQKYKDNSSPESKLFVRDFNELQSFLQQMGFIGYFGNSFGIPSEFSRDYIFELDDYYGNLLKATRENFAVKGSKKFAVLDFTDVEQRILTENKIGDRIQEDLLKWKEEYQAAQADLNVTSHYLVPRPTKNAYWENFKLSFTKYFRGDDRKVLKWGLDLSGGKTVRIGLRDSSNRPVTNPEDISQAVNELYTRINKMGVSERTIHVENQNIILDFPGSQALSASELVKASAMHFHIVNEKFTPGNANLHDDVNQFLQGVWNEAVVTNRKDVDSINEIAWQHLGGELKDGKQTRPRSESAKTLADQGLKLASPSERSVSSSFDDTLSSIAVMRGDDFSEWDGQSHPLLIVFHNYALEGANLTNIQAGYDPSQGNILSFGVKRSYQGSQAQAGGSPRDAFYSWTSQFAEDKILGTPKEVYTKGQGWRMAVVLNGVIISKPSLKAALRDGGTISGRFSQREVNQLAADLKAGSLSFTPRILSEQNVSPELGKEERVRGIVAAVVAVLLVVGAMVAYYHFAGVVAACAVVLNLLIMWGVLQNLGFALTLPAIAGIVLTIGMAVDANVLVFERIREEFKLTGRIASAIQAGYRKAFSAIIDSNVTTIIAALILIQFDSGPIKGFAVALIVGILSSMFTALFVTRYFFAGWVKNPAHKELNMSQLFNLTNFDFLGQTRKAIMISLVVMVFGAFMFVAQRNTMLGMDFTGGYSLIVDLAEKPGANYRAEASNALLAKGATSNDIQIRELSRPNQLRIQLGTSIEEKGHPFYQMPETLSEGKFMYAFQNNPRLTWVVDSLQSGGLNISPSQMENIDRNWTVMSGQLSDTMRNNAILALGLALLAVLLYITFRFEFKFAIGAVAGLVHDVVITLGILAIFHKLGFPVQVDLQVIGAIMTIIGYSLNDTIIVFDRIREDMKIHRKMKFTDMVNHALNVTLSRTVMTSGTTLLVLLSLVLLGGKSIFSFSLVMTIGVVVGTLSSLFIAAPVMIYFHNRELKKIREDISLKKA